jgi:hypothetical protein
MPSVASRIPTIYVVTPCLNAATTIDRTVQSVVSQAGCFHLHYHIQDGGSSDGTWERVRWWAEHIASAHFPKACASVTFTSSQERDEGLYDAVSRGFGRMFNMFSPADSFMTWINADDILFQGTLAYIAHCEVQFTSEQVSWLGGAAAIMKDDRLVAFYDRRLPDIAIQGGLCDGHHWSFLQQEGAFFRCWLWQSAREENCLAGLRLAGDWNLWRHFAKHSSFVQTNLPFGAFRSRDGQLSGTRRDAYLGEIDAKVSRDIRQLRMKSIFEDGPPSRRIARSHYPSTQIHIYREDLTAEAEGRYVKLFGEKPIVKHSPQCTMLLHKGIESGQMRERSPKTSIATTHTADNHAFTAFDQAWQYPAITEQHAYRRLRRLWSPTSTSFCYVGFPWATAIDHLQCNTPEGPKWLERIQELAKKLSCDRRNVTVCQHVLLKRFLPLLAECGITDIFWSHTTKADAHNRSDSGIALHPFPLFPVQLIRNSTSIAAKRVLFSFLGAQTDRHYLTPARTWIFRHLATHPVGHVKQRDQWHYHEVVYKTQIFRSDSAKQSVSAEDQAAAEFRDVLLHSVFSLCPSGSGPNSIRLWESLGAGAIPVIISDTLALPGPAALWEEAAVFCPETEEAIKALPVQLATMAEDAELLERKRLAMRQLWMQYGPDCFVPDVLKLLVDEHSDAESPVPAIPQEAPNEDAPPLVGLAREIAAGRLDMQAAGAILWRGLSTRASLSPDDLRASARRYPELVMAARLTRKLVATQSSRLLTKRVVEVLPELN